MFKACCCWFHSHPCSDTQSTHRSVLRTRDCRGVLTFGASPKDGGPPLDIEEPSSPRKLLSGIIIALCSFSASSPHFFMNLLTVFCCSIGLVRLKVDRQGVGVQLITCFVLSLGHEHVFADNGSGQGNSRKFPCTTPFPQPIGVSPVQFEYCHYRFFPRWPIGRFVGWCSLFGRICGHVR